MKVSVPALTVTPGVAALQSVLALVKVAGSNVPRLRNPLPASAMTEPNGLVPEPPGLLMLLGSVTSEGLSATIS